MDSRIDPHSHTATHPETLREGGAIPAPARVLSGARADASGTPPRPRLEPLNRALVVLSACNEAVAAATSEDDLLQRACEAIVRVGGYALSWVGYAEHDADKRVRPVAQFGFDQGYVERSRITWGEDAHGLGPTGTAIRTGRPQIAQRIASDPRFEPWRADALARGYGSTIALPLTVEGARLGALLIYAAEPDAFDEAETLMLMQAADDLALGIARQRADAGRRQAEAAQENTAAALRVQTALLDQLFESAPEAIVLLDLEDRITRANRDFQRMFGYSAEECSGRLLNDLIVPPGMMEHAMNLTHEVVRCGRQCSAESVRRRKDGSTMHVSILGAPIWSGERQIAAYAIYRDISERRRMEQMQARRARYAALRADIQSVFSHAAPGDRDALQRAAEALAQHLDGALARIWTLEGDGQPLQLSASAGLDTQVEGANSPVAPDSTLIAAVARERVPYVTRDAPADARAGGEEAGGHQGMAMFAAYPLLVDDALAGVLAVCARDPQEPDTLEALESAAGMIAQGIARLRAQDALRASEERFRAIVDQQTDLICRFRPDTTLTFVNDTYARHFGRTPEQLIGRSFLELVPVEQREFVRAQVDSLYANPREMAYEHAAISADGKQRWHQWIDHVVPDAHGHGVEFQSVGRDVTQRHEAEEALQRSEQIARAQTAVITATLQSITREPTSDAFIGQVLRTIVEQLGGMAGTFWVPAETPGTVRVYLDLEHDELVKAEDSDHPGRVPQRIIALEREAPAQLDDPRVFDFDHICNHPDYEPFRAWALRHGVRTVLQVPMVFGASIVGAYTVRFDRERSFEPQDLQLAKALALQATLAIRLTQLAEQAKSVAVSQERVAQLAQANRALTGTLDRLATEPSLDTALGHVLAAVTHQLEAHSCTLWLYDLVEGVAHLHMVYEHGRIVPAVGSEHPHAQRPISLDKPAHQRNVLDSDLAVTEVCVDNGFYPEMCEYLHSQGIRHLLSVPMRLGATVVGACFVRIYQDRMPNPERVQLARVLTQQATLLLYASRMAELAQQAALGRERETAAQERARELARVNSTLQEALALLASEPGQDRFVAYLLQRVVGQFSAHSASLLLPDEARKRIVLHLTFQDGRIYDHEAYSASPIAQAVEGDEDAARRWALFQDPHTATVSDIEDPEFPDALRRPLRAMGIHSVATAPLRLGEGVIGRLVVRFASSRGLSAQQNELLQSIANQMAVALHMSRLADEVRRAAVLDERNRMARDIHDTLAQGFTGVIVQLEAAKDAIARRRGRDTRAHIQRAADLARQSLAEARRSVRALKPLALEQGGLQAAFAALLANVTAGTGLIAHFACSGESCPLPLDVEESLLRIGQEALTNVLKHAEARHFEAMLTFDEAGIALALRDDGVGFDPGVRTDGMGLRGMHERAERLGGVIQMDSALGHGTRILVRLPRPA